MTTTLPTFLVSLNVGNSGSDPATRYVNRLEFLPGGGGHPALVAGRATRALELGAPGIYLGLPHGFHMINGLYQAEPPEFIRAAGFPLLVDDFAEAWTEITFGAGVPVLYYTGGIKSTVYIRAGRNDRERLRRARQCYQLCFDAGMMLGLDGDCAIYPNTNEAQIADALAEMQPDASKPQFIEALNGTSWGRDRPLIVLDSSYRRWRAHTGNLSWLPPTPAQAVYRIVDNLDNPDDGAPINSPAWWADAGRRQVAEIVADRHFPIINSDPFCNDGIPFKTVIGNHPGGREGGVNVQ